jgi:hypothetical protein
MKKGRTDMKRLIFVAVFVLLGCQPPLKPLPQMPPYQTKLGGECATRCQSQYNQCMHAARPADSSTYGAPDNEAINACRQMLSECYSICTEEESKTKQ